MDLLLTRATLEKRKHSRLLLELPKAKKPRKDVNPCEVIHISKDVNQKEVVKENLHGGQGSGGSGERRYA